MRLVRSPMRSRYPNYGAPFPATTEKAGASCTWREFPESIWVAARQGRAGNIASKSPLRSVSALPEPDWREEP